ncbi:PKD domain-containing protein, partial [Nanoarchaeota archaeon]
VIAGNSVDSTIAHDGTYNVTCTVTDIDGDSASDSVTVTVADTAPVVDFNWNTTQPVEAQPLEFNATVTGQDPPFTYSWDFGDGETGNVEDPEHTYAVGGDYNVTLEVTDADGSVTTVQHEIHVAQNPPQVDLYVDPLSGDEPITVNVTCVVTNGDAPITYDIDFGDGTAHETVNETIHTFDQNGTYVVNCTVTDADGDFATDIETVTIADTVPTVNFTYTPLKPQESETVDFDATMTSYDAIVDIQWDFGDGSTDNVEDPSHVYINEGNYTVTVTVTDDDGSVASYSDVVEVGINMANVTLMATATSGVEPLLVDFACIALGGNPPYEFMIDFGDGENSTSSMATHNYTQNGTYTATCYVNDSDGDVSSDFEIIDVLDSVPSVDFTFDPADPMEGENVTFTSVVSFYDTPATFAWDFGDSSSSTETDPSHIFAAEGDYNVTLDVTDGDGSIGTAWYLLTVGNDAPLVSLEASELNPAENENVTFNCTAAGGNEPLGFLVDYGDGSTTTSPVSDYSFVTPGTYVVFCNVTDDDGDMDSDFVVINVANNAPNVTLSAIPSTGPEGLTVVFDCDVTGGDDPVGVVLDFGDGSSTTNTTASHTYPLEGIYSASCTATDDDGDFDMDSQDINITDNVPVVNIVTNVTSGDEPLSLNYTCNVGGGNDPLTYVIDFGDGSATSSSPTGDHVYTIPGIYTISCDVTDVDGDVGYHEHDIEVFNNAPQVTLTASPSAAPEGTEIDFDCVVAGGNDPLNYVLDFGDGSSTTTATASHNYTLEGLYNATCMVTDADADVGIDSVMVNISNNAPVVNLALNVSSGYEPLDMNYTCTVGNGNDPITYVVDFGDGSPTSSSPTGSHSYPNPGNYTVSCQATDADGDTATDVEALEVLNYAPVVDLIAVPTTGPEGVEVDFDCLVTGGNDPLNYVLDFGDGASTTSSTAKHIYALEGVYNATCTVTDADADVGIDSELINITDNPPVVSLNVNATSGLEPLSVNYTCTVGNGNAPFNYVIDFGDGSPTTAATEGAHTYVAPGNYVMSCTVTDTDGDVGSNTQSITVIDNPPIVTLLASPTTGMEGVEVDFDCSVVNGNSPFTYVIDFGDGASTTTSIAKHIYPLEGVYNATCTVQDADGDVDVDSQIINITNNPPVVNLNVNVTSGLEPLSVNYTCNVGGGNAPLAYVVDFGDGSPTTSATSGAHTYPNPGSYPLSCTVTDTDGDVDSDSELITVIDNPPIVDLTYSYSGALTEGVNVSFMCDVTNGNAPFSYVLAFGDGTTTTSNNASRVYPLEGVYNATCTVTDADGDVGVDAELLNVSNNVPIVNLVQNITAGTEPLSVDFNCTLVGDGNAPFVYSIDFGDGSAPVATQTASHTYVQNSTYTAICTATDTDGDVSIPDTEAIFVFDSEPNTTFTYLPASPIEGDLIQFTDGSTAYDGLAAWSWTFGDGNTSTAQNPTHTYMLEGPYVVTLTTTDGDGSQTSHVELVSVGNNAPVATVSVAPLSGTEPLTVSVTCSATGGNAPLSYDVLYGDGQSTNVTSSVHTYTQDGTYPVTCLATDVDGDVDSDVEMVTVNDTAPVAAFTYSPANPYAGDTVDFTDGSTAYDGIASWAWDFTNDGTTDATTQNTSNVFSSPGLYVVNLTVTDNDGSTDSTIRTVAVNVSIPAPIIFSVQAIGITNVSANITWGTDQSSDSLVEYGLTTALGSSTSDATMTFSHNMPLSGLTPNTTYYYNVTSCNSFAKCSTSGPFNFTTSATSVPDTTPPANVTGLGETAVGSD